MISVSQSYSHWRKQALSALEEKTKPPGSLGRLEAIAAQLAGIQRTLNVRAERARMLIFAASHGVAASGVSAYPAAVTAQMVATFLRGGAAINVLCRALNLDLVVIDVGVDDSEKILPQFAPGFIRRAVAQGTANFVTRPAMSAQEVGLCRQIGREVVEGAHQEGFEVIALGEMGIANTTSAAALSAGLLCLDPRRLVGRGTGVDDMGLQRKQEIVAQAVSHFSGKCKSPDEWLAAVGGFEIAAMTGAVMRAAELGLPVIVDGFIATAAILPAWFEHPHILENCFFAHRSSEAGHSVLLEKLGVTPILDLDLRLGEGTGAALAWPLLRAAARILTDMATFSEASVSRANA